MAEHNQIYQHELGVIEMSAAIHTASGMCGASMVRTAAEILTGAGRFVKPEKMNLELKK
jgi:hypothetical protein